jgi:hypothetical protein
MEIPSTEARLIHHSLTVHVGLHQMQRFVRVEQD